MNDPESAIYTGEPDIGQLITEYQRCGSSGNYWGRSVVADETRLAIWEGQSLDGKKHDENLPDGQMAFPFEGASDVRCYQADELCNEDVALLTAAFWRADLRVTATSSAGLEAASQATTYLRWLVHQKESEHFDEEVELSAQYAQWYGWVGLHVDWEREVAYRIRKVKLQDLIQLAQQIQQSDLSKLPPEEQHSASNMALFPSLILNPDSQGQAADVLVELYKTYVLQSLPEDLREEDIASLPRSKALKMVKELSAKQSTEIPMPYLCRNLPRIWAKKPWREMVIPTDTTNVQSCRHPFIRTYMSEAEVRTMVRSDDWDPDWVEAACKTKGMMSAWTYNAGSNLLTDSPVWNGNPDQTDNQQIEVLTAYEKKVDEQGILGVYYTIFSAFAAGKNGTQNLFAKHALLNYPASIGYPVVFHRRERLDRRLLASRGLPEIFSTSQKEEKAMRDAIIDNASMSVVPPINVPRGIMGQRYKIGPAIQNDVVPGREPKFMEVPTQGVPIAMEYLALIDQKVGRYNGRFAADVPPAFTQVMLEPKVRKFLFSWSRALWMAYQLTLKFNPELIQQVTGFPVNTESEDSEMNFVMHFDVTQFNPDIMAQKMKSFADLRMQDSNGIMDSDKLIAMQARMIDPAMATELIQEGKSASQKLKDSVSMDLLKMFAGQESDYKDMSNDPTAPAKMNLARQLIGSNLKYLASLDPKFLAESGLIPQGQQLPPQIAQAPKDPMFTNFTAKYLQNIKMGAQQQQNKQVGLTGIKQ